MSLTQNTTDLRSLLETIKSLPDYVDTSGTATAADIFTGKTATVNDAKVTGTNPYNAANVDPAVTSALAALAEKGVDTTGAGLANLASLIAAIEAGGGGASIEGYNIQAGTIVLESDTSSSESLLGVGSFEANKAYTTLMFVLGVHSDLFSIVGKKGMVGSVSKRSHTSNNNNTLAALAFNDYGSGVAVVNAGLSKQYARDYMSLLASSNAICKAGVVYGWIAIEDGV